MSPAASEGDWTQPGAYFVAPGVHRIPLPLPNDGLRAVNVYAIDDGEQVMLVDSGWALAHSRYQLAKALGTLGFGLPEVTRFLVTHAHRDHYSQAVVLRRDFGITVALGSGERPSVELLVSGRAGPENYHYPQLVAAGAAELVERLRATGFGDKGLEDWESPDHWLDDLASVVLRDRELAVHHTPGHTRGHVVFADRANGLLFAGDHVLPHITPSIGFEPRPERYALRSYLASLRLVRSQPDAVLLPAHGPVSPSTHDRIDELLQHHGARLDATETAVLGDSVTGYEVAKRLRWTRRGRRFDELDVVNQMLAVNETVAHLEVLVVQGRVAAADIAGVRHYGDPMRPAERAQ